MFPCRLAASRFPWRMRRDAVKWCSEINKMVSAVGLSTSSSLSLHTKLKVLHVYYVQYPLSTIKVSDHAMLRAARLLY